MAIEFKDNDYGCGLVSEFDSISNVNIRKHETLGVTLDLEDFYGEFSIEDLEKILSKMKELQSAQNNDND